MGNIFCPSYGGDIPDYFIIKAYTIENPISIRALQDDELGRLYYASHPEEGKPFRQILRLYGLK